MTKRHICKDQNIKTSRHQRVRGSRNQRFDSLNLSGVHTNGNSDICDICVIHVARISDNAGLSNIVGVGSGSDQMLIILHSVPVKNDNVKKC